MCPAEAIHQSLFTFTLRYFFIIDYPLCTLTVIILAFRYYSLIFSSLLRGDIDFRHRELLIAMFIINTNRVNTQPKIIILNFTVFFSENGSRRRRVLSSRVNAIYGDNSPGSCSNSDS